MRHEVKAATTILSTELSTDIVGKQKYSFINEGLADVCRKILRQRGWGQVLH